MSNDYKALIYYYNKLVHSINFNEVKGLKKKSCMDFVNLIRKLGVSISKGEVIDFNDYYDVEV